MWQGRQKSCKKGSFRELSNYELAPLVAIVE